MENHTSYQDVITYQGPEIFYFFYFIEERERPRTQEESEREEKQCCVDLFSRSPQQLGLAQAEVKKLD